MFKTLGSFPLTSLSVPVPDEEGLPVGKIAFFFFKNLVEKSKIFQFRFGSFVSNRPWLTKLFCITV
jgi:uncharacterized membrane protein YczE